MLQSLLSGNVAAATDEVRARLSEGMPHESVVTDVLLTARSAIHDLRDEGRATLLQEKRADRIIALCLSEAKSGSKRRGDNGCSVAIMGVLGDSDDVLGQAVADVLEVEGWDAHFAGCGLPPWSIASYCYRSMFRAVVAIATPIDCIGALKDTLAAVSDRQPLPALIVAGDCAEAILAKGEKIGAHCVWSPREALEACRRLLDDGARRDCDLAASTFGMRASAAMLRCNKTPESIAKELAVDPGYLGAVMAGRTNVDLDTMVRVAKAVRVPLAALLAPD